jgi:hypothetical protein
VGVSLDLPLRDAREQFEKQYFLHHIRREDGNMSRVADRVGSSARTSIASSSSSGSALPARARTPPARRQAKASILPRRTAVNPVFTLFGTGITSTQLS